jgi:hypothetical protein
MIAKGFKEANTRQEYSSIPAFHYTALCWGQKETSTFQLFLERSNIFD